MAVLIAIIRTIFGSIAAFYSKDHHCSVRKHAHYYGRDRAKTLITKDGTALQRCLVWTGPGRAAAIT
ncbi:MAG: hypothetical protein OIF58_10390, partial [Cohaesibacter sp.]|nr:hypothetical protein [Cohaesibacter sp.]